MQHNWLKLLLLSIASLVAAFMASNFSFTDGATSTFVEIAAFAVIAVMILYVGRGIGSAINDSAEG